MPGYKVFKKWLFLIDRFHKRVKHKKGHKWCDSWCDAGKVPWLYDEDGNQVGNSSICEQTNAWISRALPLLRSMSPIFYHFFLDEIITERNRWTKDKLRKRGKIVTTQEDEEQAILAELAKRLARGESIAMDQDDSDEEEDACSVASLGSSGDSQEEDESGPYAYIPDA